MPYKIEGFSGVVAEVDANTRALRTTLRPADIGALGSYRMTAVTGTMAAGIVATSPWFSFRWPDATNLAVIRSVRVGMASIGAFTNKGSGLFELVVARSFTASDTGGTDLPATAAWNQKLKTSMATSLVVTTDMRIATTAALGTGTRTLDGLALASVSWDITTAANTTLLNAGTSLFTPTANEWPLVLAQDEGFIVRCTMPATGTWTGHCQVAWDEVASY
jgi:hypothetical protein